MATQCHTYVLHFRQRTGANARRVANLQKLRDLPWPSCWNNTMRYLPMSSVQNELGQVLCSESASIRSQGFNSGRSLVTVIT
eukprot:4914364-Pleurochrysis_carterae.AAC.1